MGNPKKIGVASASDLAYLGMLQDIIARMGYDSFKVKAFSIMVFCALVIVSPFMFRFGYHTEFVDRALLFAVLLPFVGFAFLDGFYLRLERAYRIQFIKTSTFTGDQQLFKLAPMYLSEVSYRSVMISTTQVWFYLAQMTFLQIVIILQSY